MMCAGSHRHDASCYRHHGCRCQVCTAAMRDYMRERRGSGPRGWVAEEYQHLRDMGLSVAEIARHRGVQRASVERTLRRASKAATT